MSRLSLPKHYRGVEISLKLNTLEERRTPLIEGFLMPNDCMMIYSQPGLGKSLLTTQLALEASAGLPIWGFLKVSRPLVVYYIQKERHETEFFDRIRHMMKHITPNFDNIIHDPHMQAISFADDRYWLEIISRIKFENPDIIIIDPIYAGTPGLSKDEVGSAVTSFLTRLEYETQAAVIIDHHETKDSYNKDGDKIMKDDPFYGSVWFKAHVTGQYQMTHTKDGCVLTNKKDSHACLLSQIFLEYNQDTELSNCMTADFPIEDRFNNYLNRMLSTGVHFSFEESRIFLNCSPRQMRDLLSITKFCERIKNLSKPKTKAIYEVVK